MSLKKQKTKKQANPGEFSKLILISQTHNL
jgi:hypothetical protein